MSGKRMKEIDRYTIEEIKIPSVVLMERAAYAVAAEIKKLIKQGDHIWVACGTGNNGADGIAAARILFLWGYKAYILLADEYGQGTEEYRQQLAIAQNLGMRIKNIGDFASARCDVIVDALFGVGLNRGVKGNYLELIQLINHKNAAIVVSVDIPSGIRADTGAVFWDAVKADITVTFGYEKLGTALFPGKAYGGRVIVADIGFPRLSLEHAGFDAFTYEHQDIRLLPERPAYSNKGKFGKVLVVAGSANMSGAAYLCSMAAYRMGAGLVKILTPEANRIILQEQLPEAILEVYEPKNLINMSKVELDVLKNHCAWATVIVLGPGLSQEPYTKNLVEGILSNARVPVILDADGLNCLAAFPFLTEYYTEHTIITPHLGEMARLTGLPLDSVRDELVNTAKDYARRYGITCVLKDAVTVTALKDGRICLNTSGSSAMAKAGSGDVLSGIIAGLAAIGMKESEAAAMGVYLHGLAGKYAACKKGEHGVLARDLTDGICAVIKENQSEASHE